MKGLRILLKYLMLGYLGSIILIVGAYIVLNILIPMIMWDFTTNKEMFNAIIKDLVYLKIGNAIAIIVALIVGFGTLDDYCRHPHIYKKE